MSATFPPVAKFDVKFRVCDFSRSQNLPWIFFQYAAWSERYQINTTHENCCVYRCGDRPGCIPMRRNGGYTNVRDWCQMLGLPSLLEKYSRQISRPGKSRRHEIWRQISRLGGKSWNLTSIFRSCVSLHGHHINAIKYRMSNRNHSHFCFGNRCIIMETFVSHALSVVICPGHPKLQRL